MAEWRKVLMYMYYILIRVLGVRAGFLSFQLRDCSSQLGNEVQSVLEKAKAAGKSVGFVTTTYVNHASPSGVFGKTAERTWYSDKRMANDPNVDDEGQDYLYY